MKAAVIEADNVLTVKEVPEPAIGEYDVLIDILYGATCTGTPRIRSGVPTRASPWICGAMVSIVLKL